VTIITAGVPVDDVPLFGTVPALRRRGSTEGLAWNLYRHGLLRPPARVAGLMLLSFERPTPPLEAGGERTALAGSGARRGTHPAGTLKTAQR
jgi:hypothetical protein